MCAIAASVGLSLFQGLAMRSAATQAAEDTAEIERQGVKSAEDAKRNKQLALAERKQEETVAARQDQFAKRIDTLVATEIPVVASSIALFLTELLPLPVNWFPPSSSFP